MQVSCRAKARGKNAAFALVSTAANESQTAEFLRALRPLIFSLTLFH